MLVRIDEAIRRLAPTDEFHRTLADILRATHGPDMSICAGGWWRRRTDDLLAAAEPDDLMAGDDLRVFGISSPRNRVVYATMLLCAFSISSAVFMILELDSPLGGWIVVSSQPLREALRHVDAPLTGGDALK